MELYLSIHPLVKTRSQHMHILFTLRCFVWVLGWNRQLCFSVVACVLTVILNTSLQIMSLALNHFNFMKFMWEEGEVRRCFGIVASNHDWSMELNSHPGRDNTQNSVNLWLWYVIFFWCQTDFVHDQLREKVA